MKEIHRNEDVSTNPHCGKINPDMFQGNLQAFKGRGTLPVAMVVLSLLASSCDGEDGVIPNIDVQASETQPRVTEVFETPTPKPTNTPEPTSTITVTPTETMTPTPDIQVIIRGLTAEYGLNPEREYVFVTTDTGEYLVDTFNQGKMLRREGGGWVETDWGERYGHLLPEEPRMEYVSEGIAIGDMYYHDDRRFLGRTIRPIATGNSRDVVMFDERQGREITMTFLETVFRYNGEVVPLYAYLGSDDLPGTKIIGLDFRNTEARQTGSRLYIVQTTDEIIGRITPGSQLSIRFQFQRPQVTIPDRPCSEATGYCIDDYAAMVELFWEQVDDLVEFNRRLEAGEDISDLAEELLIPTAYPSLYVFEDAVPDWVTEYLEQED